MKAQNHAVFVTGGNDVVIPDGTAGLCDILDTGLSGPLHIITKGEESVGAAGNAALLGNPGLFLLGSQHLRLDFKGLLPDAISQHVFILIGDIHVDGIVPVGPANAIHKLQAQHLGMLPQEPVIRLTAGQPGTVNPGLLSCAYADGLAIFHIADGIGLGVFQGNQRRSAGRFWRFQEGPCWR